MSQLKARLGHAWEGKFKPLDGNAVHLCIDMQKLFGFGSEWHMPWLERVLPAVEQIVAARPKQTIFTRFVPLRRLGLGAWRRYYGPWHAMTLPEAEPGHIDLLPELAHFVPPAEVIDKAVYSPWMAPHLGKRLSERQADVLIITGIETDICVLSAVLGAVDRGYRVVIPTDAICSSSDEAHNALLGLWRTHYSLQVETPTTAELLSTWA